ncbi:MAG: hypothetical protein F6K42_27880 [Leptolyngbya sp. SIO1D8]|nr:hypothetical protein [Leptolyngbya sp. SIO1D8]
MRQLALRGRNYKKAMQVWIPILVADAVEIYVNEKKLTALAISRIAVKRNFPIKTTFEFLEYAKILPSGTWDRLVDRGFTAAKAKAAVAAQEVST